MNWKQQIIDDIIAVMDGLLDSSDLVVERPKERGMADYAIPCFSLAKKLRKSPVDIANMIKDKLTGYEKIDVVNGYLNIFVLKQETTEYVINKIISEQAEYGTNDYGKGKRIVIDYSAPNIAKPFGIGHLRSTAIGESIKRICLKNGFDVVTINYLGDYGTQFGKLIYAYKKWADKEAFLKNPISELRRVYVKFHKEAEQDPSLDDKGRAWFKRLEDGDQEAKELWQYFKQESLKEFDKTYQLLGIDSFDSYDGEAYYSDKMTPIIEELEEKQLLEESEGASVVYLDGEEVPALIKRSDGGTLYITRDLAALFDRKQRYQFDEMVYVVGNEQSHHFVQLKKIVQKMEYDWSDQITHVNFGMILQDGKKMSTRKGKSFDLYDLLQESIALAKQYIEEKQTGVVDVADASRKIGVGAIIFHDLKNDRINDIEFQLENVLKFEGETGPYLQYTYARIMSLLGKCENTQLDLDKIDYNAYIWNVVFRLYEFQDVIVKAKKGYDPSEIAKYCIDLAQDFNKLYTNEKFISEDLVKTAFYMHLIQAVAVVLKEGLRLLGLEVLERM